MQFDMIYQFYIPVIQDYTLFWINSSLLYVKMKIILYLHEI